MILARMVQHPISGANPPFAEWRLLFQVDHVRNSESVWYDISGQPTFAPAHTVPVLPKTLSSQEAILARLGLRRIARDWGDKVAWIQLHGSGKEQSVSQVWATDMGLESGSQ